MTRAFLPTPTNVPANATAYDDTARALEQLYALVPWLEGKEVQVGDSENPITGGQAIDVNHFLGRVARGWILLDLVSLATSSALTQVFRRDADSSDENTLQIYAESNVRHFKVWVY